MAEADSLNTGKLSFLFFFHPKDKKELQFLFKRDQMDYPVFIDSNNEIDRLNDFPEQQSYQCFLLSKDTKVLMIGNPILNPRIWGLYKDRIFGEKEEKQTMTTVEVDKTMHDFGNIQTGKRYPAVFQIKNTGNYPLIISQVSTSCGCTAAEWEKKPIEPGKTTEIKAIMNPEEEGYFNKTIEVFCNIKESPLKLITSGTANK
jgi:hypothetical protein